LFDNHQQKIITTLKDFIDKIITTDATEFNALLNDVKSYIYADKFLSEEYFRRVGIHTATIKKRNFIKTLDDILLNIQNAIKPTGCEIKHGFWGTSEDERKSFFYPNFGNLFLEEAKTIFSFGLNQAEADGLISLYNKILMGYLASIETADNADTVRKAKNELSKCFDDLYNFKKYDFDFYVIERENNFLSTNIHNDFWLFLYKTALLKVLSDLLFEAKKEKTFPKNLIKVYYKKNKLNDIMTFKLNKKDFDLSPLLLLAFRQIITGTYKPKSDTDLHNITSDINEVSKDAVGKKILKPYGKGEYYIDEEHFNPQFNIDKGEIFPF
jgi:hypothetical protein